MEKETVIKLRELAYNFKFTLYAKDPSNPVQTLQFRTPLMIVCDNSLNIVDDPYLQNVIWDDENERFFYFTANDITSFYNPVTYAMSFGDEPAWPGLMIMVDYGEIQNMRVQFNREIFEQIATKLSMPEEQKKKIIAKIFDANNQKKAIERKRKISYVTGSNKNSVPANRHYDDNDEYEKTIHVFSN